MRFQQLLHAVGDSLIYRPTQDAHITAPIAEDTRMLQSGGVFLARKGSNRDGHDLIAQAVNNGAVAVIGERPPDKVHSPVPYAQVDDPQQSLGLLAAAYYGYPSRQLVMIGVTGTDGKTTTATILYNILKAAGHRVGMISTVSAMIGDLEFPTGLHVTTPGAPDVQMYLRRMADNGLTHCILESTSHGLAQGRLNGVDFDMAIVTNITHEHLDFHGTLENYRDSKGLLFKGLKTSYHKSGVPKIAVINADDASADYLRQFPADLQIMYGVGSETLKPDLSATAQYSPTSTTLTVQYAGQPSTHGGNLAEATTPFTMQTMLVGNFNVQNILAATGAALALGCVPDQIRDGLWRLPQIPGRMERIQEGQSFMAIVDFAHTPNALQRTLEASRSIVAPSKRIIAVFGSAGLRDREKRSLMAEIGIEKADVCILTAEDPRTEPLAEILQTMADAAMSKGGVEGKSFYRIEDRGEAIHFACMIAEPGDLVIACGKGHEQSMCFDTTEYPWDDRNAMRAAIHGNAMRNLPTARTRE